MRISNSMWYYTETIHWLDRCIIRTRRAIRLARFRGRTDLVAALHRRLNELRVDAMSWRADRDQAIENHRNNLAAAN